MRVRRVTKLDNITVKKDILYDQNKYILPFDMNTKIPENLNL